jgi:hypothetical protein
LLVKTVWSHINWRGLWYQWDLVIISYTGR